jgi:hypothetical protein
METSAALEADRLFGRQPLPAQQAGNGTTSASVKNLETGAAAARAAEPLDPPGAAEPALDPPALPAAPAKPAPLEPREPAAGAEAGAPEPAPLPPLAAEDAELLPAAAALWGALEPAPAPALEKRAGLGLTAAALAIRDCSFSAQFDIKEHCQLQSRCELNAECTATLAKHTCCGSDVAGQQSLATIARRVAIKHSQRVTGPSAALHLQ